MIPARHVAGPLIWNDAGEVWALFRLSPVTYPYLDRRAKLDLHARTRAALLALPGESMLLSLAGRIEATDVVEAMVAGVDLPAHPAWARAAEATFDALGELDLYRRVHFVAARLPDASPRASLGAAVASARARVAGRFGLPPLPPSPAEVASRRRQAEEVGSALHRTLAVRPARAAEVAWVYARAPRRGLGEPALGEGAGGGGTEVAGAALWALGEAVCVEGGERADASRPRHRRYLRVETEAGVSYQSFLVVADMPHRFSFPDGAEWLPAAERVAFPVDWCARIRPVGNAEAQRRARRQARALVGQVDEYEGEPAGAPGTLAEALEGIDDERAALAQSPGDPELEVTMVFCVWAEDLEVLEARAGELRGVYQAADYGLPRPTGGQLALFQAMLPGAPTPPVARHYTQYLLPRDLAAGMPFAGTEVGDPGGMLLGVSLDGGAARPVLFDPAYGPAEARSGSLGAVGDLGSGKSFFIKCVAWATLARGGQVVALDRTPRGEWVDFAAVAPGRPQVVRLAPDADVCLDPLRVFSGPDRVRVAIGFLSLLTRTAPSDLEGTALAQAVRAVAARPSGRLRDVVDELAARGEADPDASVVGRKLAHLCHEDLAGLVFGDGTPLDLADADFIVFHTPGLSLPDREVLLSEHLARQLLGEQLLSQALLYLAAAVARGVAFADPARFAAVLIDEAWAITSSLEGQALLLEGVRDGRKHNAALWLCSQHPDDLGEPRLRDLLRNRLVFRQSKASARRALEFLGADAGEAAAALVESGLETGQCLFRDVRGRTGLIQVLPAPLPEVAAAFDTNPLAGVRTSPEEA